MSTAPVFLSRIEAKIEQQLSSQKVGYLIGAGTSYLDRRGYPLTSDLWGSIGSKVRAEERNEIQQKLDGGATGIEMALDLLDDGSAIEKPHRHLVMEAIAEYFQTITPPTDVHQNFIRRLASRDELDIPIFSLNYDGLVELASDIERVPLVDGFQGMERPYFDPQVFQELRGIRLRGRREFQVHWKKGSLRLYKLHGSLGWFDLGNNEVRKLGLSTKTPEGAKRLMVPPQHRKGIETTSLPYSALWSDFRAKLCNGPSPLNRLVVIGYGMGDEHLNAVIENALVRDDFTLLIFAQVLRPEFISRWSSKRNVVIVTQSQSSLNGEIGQGHENLWDFGTLAGRV